MPSPAAHLHPAGFPDFPDLIRSAQRHRRPVLIEHARAMLGRLLDEEALETDVLIVRGSDVWLPPSTWLRMLVRAMRASAAEGVAGGHPRPSTSSAGARIPFPRGT